jgi:hypothetical protein
MWAAIAGYHSVIIIIVVIVGEDVKRIIVVSVALVYKWHCSDDIWCRDIV